MKNSLILNFILQIPEKMHIGVINVVSKINKIEIPSIPNLKLIKLFNHFFSSINWKFEVVVSKEYHKISERKKFTTEVKIATYEEFFSIFLLLPLVIKINKAPIKGIKTIVDKIGKFIYCKIK